MENKYYQPEIEDFSVGYECEWIYEKNTSHNYYKNPEIYDWQKHTITLKDFSDHDLADVFHNIHNDSVSWRTKWLDREDIESLGFKYIATDILAWEKNEKTEIFLLNNVYLHYISHYKTLIIKEKGVVGFDLYRGKYKSINEFRKLLKMIL